MEMKILDLRYRRLPVEAQLPRYLIAYTSILASFAILFQLWQPHGCFCRSHDGHMRVSRHF